MNKMNFLGAIASIILFLSGCSSSPMNRTYSTEDVGTAWGEDVRSSVTSVSATRESQEPTEVIIINYAKVTPKNQQQTYSIRAGELEYAVRDNNFKSMPIIKRYNPSSRQWQFYIAAKAGVNYQLYVRNFSFDNNYEVVATVDGLDVLNGKPGSLHNNGYIVNAGKSLAIRGFRKDRHTEAAFQFSDISDSYAANSTYGNASNTGVIGFATFRLQQNPTASLPPCSAQAFPADVGNYAPPPCHK
jgi:hypothetical protein